MNFSNLTTTDYQAICVGIFFWAWFFVWAAGRSFKAGLLYEEPPVYFRHRNYKFARILFLPIMVYGFFGVGYGDLIEGENLVDLFGDVVQGVYMGPVAGVLVAAALLWGIPILMMRRRMRHEENPGEWGTAAFVFFRWCWLGLILLLSIGYFQVIEFFDGLLPFPIDPGTGAAVAGGGGVLYLLLWGLPSSLVARNAAQAEPAAVDMLPTVRWIGLPAYVVYLTRRRTRTSVTKRDGPQKLCPSCMRPTNDLGRYESLQFENCPHCGEVIPPVFTINDYVLHYSELVEESLDGAHGKGKHGKKSGKQKTDMVQRVLRAILTMAIRERGTDVHVLKEHNRCHIRCRTDGVLFTMLELPEELLRLIVSTIKVQSDMDISERRKPQDGSFKTVVDDRKLDVRVNTSPASDGEAASLRLLYRSRVLGTLDRLGMGRRSNQMMTECITRPHGLILVTGPTGSGKSTTLYNALGTIADGKRNIITLEDPIEFQIDGLTQMQINSRKGFDFTTGLRSILRQDPDVIMVGEIRDSETAKMTIDAAMTGHLVFSTLHTIDTTTTVGRLLDLGVDAHRHAEALLMIIAQRLVRRVCQSCAEDIEMTSEQLAEMGFPGAPETLKFKLGKGCERCHDSGFFEREGIYEVFKSEPTLRKMIGDRAAPYEIRRQARKQGMRTLLEDGFTKAILGRTTTEEVLRVTS